MNALMGRYRAPRRFTALAASALLLAAALPTAPVAADTLLPAFAPDGWTGQIKENYALAYEDSLEKYTTSWERTWTLHGADAPIDYHITYNTEIFGTYPGCVATPHSIETASGGGTAIGQDFYVINPFGSKTYQFDLLQYAATTFTTTATNCDGTTGTSSGEVYSNFGGGVRDQVFPPLRWTALSGIDTIPQEGTGWSSVRTVSWSLTSPDSDGDGLIDARERAFEGTDPAKRDTDGDTLTDGEEVFGDNPYGYTSNPLVVDTDGDTYSDDVEVAAGSDPNDPNSTPLCPSCGTAADVGLTKTVASETVQLGKLFAYTLTATNYGPETAANVRIADSLPTSTTFVFASSTLGSCIAIGAIGAQVECSLGSIANGSSAVVTIAVVSPLSGSITNTATVGTSTTDPNPANDSAQATVSVGASLADLDGDGVPNSSDPFDARGHYRIEARAWIPFAQVVDPLYPEPVLFGGLFGIPPSLDTGCLAPKVKQYWRYSTYRGDGAAHYSYDGSFRAQTWIDFDWNGTNIVNVTTSDHGEYGTTHRDFLYFKYGNKHRPIGTQIGQCTKEATATEFAAARQTTAYEFLIDIHATNPLAPPGSPSIDARYGINFDPNQISFDFTTDHFPDHGIRILKDGLALRTDVVLNASCKTVLGVTGLAVIGSGLSDLSNNGSRSLDLNPKFPADLGNEYEVNCD